MYNSVEDNYLLLFYPDYLLNVENFRFVRYKIIPYSTPVFVVQLSTECFCEDCISIGNLLMALRTDRCSLWGVVYNVMSMEFEFFLVAYWALLCHL